MHKYEPCINERRIRVDGDVCPVVTCPEANKICFDMSRQSMFQQEVLLVPFADTSVLVWTPWETTNIDITEISSSLQKKPLFSVIWPEVLSQLRKLGNGHYQCLLYHYTSNRKNNTTRHIMTKHIVWNEIYLSYCACHYLKKKFDKGTTDPRAE